MNDLAERHPRFQGSWEDLHQFELLASTPPRSPERGDALRAWERYKIQRQFAAWGGSSLRKKGPHMGALISRVIDLTGADLDEICIGYVDLRGAILDHCSLRSAWLKGANLENASLRYTDFSERPGGYRGAGRLLSTLLRGADLTGAILRGVDFTFASLNDAKLNGADLSDADLSYVNLVRADIDQATLRNTRVFGTSAWDLKGIPKLQQDLVISPGALGDKAYYYVLRKTEKSEDVSAEGNSEQSAVSDSSREFRVTVDNLKVAQFVYLLLRNQEIRNVIDALTCKVVLILGRFTQERKRLLDAIRDQLRKRDRLPLLFDFEQPRGQTTQETVSTLAHMSRFVIADLTDAKSVLQELAGIVPSSPSVIVQPLLLASQEEPGMWDFFSRFPWVLKPVRYADQDSLIAALDEQVIAPAEARGVPPQWQADNAPIARVVPASGGR